MFKLISFNVNGVRARPHQLQALVEKHHPDVVGLQEIKVQDQDFPEEIFRGLNYQVSWYGQKSHYGVALMARQAPVVVHKGLQHKTQADDSELQRRLIAGQFVTPGGTTIHVLNGYFPQGESRDNEIKYKGKEKFYAGVLDYLQQYHKPTDAVVLMGDLNVAPSDLDIGIGEDNRKRWLNTGKCSFLPEEREWFEKIISWGLHDSYRIVNPQVSDRFSWFDYRSKGFEREPRRGLRIDFILVSDALVSKVSDAGIDYDLRALDRPSDHCPVWVELDIA